MVTKKETGFKELESGFIPLADIEISFNFRKTFDETKLKELADNIAKVGVLQPIILRREGKTKILVAGERRYRAAKMAGLKEIPYRLLDLTEEDAQEVTALENLHRADLNPVEEAQAFSMLLNSGNYTVQDVAHRVDKSERYVYATIKLLELPEEALTALITGQITSGHARQLLRVSSESKDFKELLQIAIDGESIKNLACSIENRIGKYMEYAKFPLDKDYAGMPPCKGCSFNSEYQTFLFENEATSEGRCTNPACYKKKEKQYKEDSVAKKADKGIYKGMANLGVGQYSFCGWQSHLFKGKPVVKGDMLKKLDKEIKASPEKFGVGFTDYNLEPVVVCLDADLIEKHDLKEEKVDPNMNSDKNRFISARIEEILKPSIKAAADKFDPSKKETLLALADDLDGFDMDLIFEIFEIESFDDKELKKLSQENLLKLLLMVGGGLTDERILEFISGEKEAKKIKSAAEKQAEKEWKEQQAKEVPTKKEKKK